MRSWFGFLLISLVVVPSGWAEQLRPDVLRENLQQGGFYVARVPQGARVNWNGEAVPVRKDGLLVLGFDRFQAERNSLEVCLGEECTTTSVRVKERAYKVQMVTKVPANTVNPGKAELARMKADDAATKQARQVVVAAAPEVVAMLEKPFAAPVGAVPTSGVFGSRRTYNGEERSWHKGHDFAAETGTPVRAPADGVVRLARSTFMSGNLIMLDHGAGLATVYAHLSRMEVKLGDRVKKGQIVGKVGTTGRSSGPHLHWGMYWHDTAIDPRLWLEQTETTEISGKGDE